MFCERCGSEIADTAMTCPRCGANLSRKFKNDTWHPAATNYGQYLEEEPHSSYKQGYAAPSENSHLFYKEKQEFPQPNHQMPPQPHPVEPLHYAGSTVHPPSNMVKVSTKNNNALIVEIILSLFGLFGVGWLMAGETIIGTILLVCSILIYWPLIILGTIFTFGLGLICLGPLAIGAIILNILLLNKVLDRKSTQYIITPQPMYMNTPQSK